ncbi:hypothetical protein GH714_018062 [Hevea brasiliensis]|uniref:Proteasome alpha-type subunits domain-containing protein n=1 Tax=Hevea brasiliensis TaxID=3981 RepID=A0A6A6LLA3_HEVBR|nr:hypothetical protein GH714_018062 [Hevea brasiliensis]
MPHPIKNSSPARHNTPANKSGPLPSGNSSGTNSSINISQLQACHLAKLQHGSQYDSVTTNWSSREEEEEEISKSLRHFETGITGRRSVSDSRAAPWEEEEKTKCCLRYQREEAKIQAWLNLQTAKAEAQSRKLEFIYQLYGFIMLTMPGSWTEYDRGVNTFSPEGRLFQVEYAIEAIKEPCSVEKVMEIDSHIGCAMSGLIADARTLVEHARVETQNHRFSYGEPMTVESTTQALCDLALRFGEGDEESMSRPFGVSLLIAGHDENGPSLYIQIHLAHFGNAMQRLLVQDQRVQIALCRAIQQGIDTYTLMGLFFLHPLPMLNNLDMTLQEAEAIALSILKQVMEEKVTPNNVNIARVAPTYHLYTPARWRPSLVAYKKKKQCREISFDMIFIPISCLNCLSPY